MTAFISPFSGICSDAFGTRVSLHKWWLTKIDSTCESLGVGGFAFTKGQGIRIFQSAAISKRHNSDLIDTVDGITIHLVGFIDEPRTCENGFTIKVCDFFRLGFPYDWEEYTKDDFGEISNDNHLPVSFDDIPVAQVRDLLRYPLNGKTEYEEMSKIIFNDILRKCDDNTIHPTDNTKNLIPVDHNHSDGDCILIDKPQKSKSTKKYTRDPTPGVATRSMRKQRVEKEICLAEKERGSNNLGDLSDNSGNRCSLKRSGRKVCFGVEKEPEAGKCSMSVLRRSTRKKK